MADSKQLSRLAIAIPYLFIFRRLALVVLFLQNDMMTQLILFPFVLFYIVMIYLAAVKPFIDKTDNFIEVLQEGFLLIGIYFIYINSDYVPEAQLRYNIGYVLIGTFALMIIVNLGAVAYTTIKSLVKPLRICMMKRSIRESQR